MFSLLRKRLCVLSLVFGLVFSPVYQTQATDPATVIAAISSSLVVVGSVVKLLKDNISKACCLNACDTCAQARQRCTGGIKYHVLLKMMPDDLDGDLLLMFDKFGRALDENLRVLKGQAKLNIDGLTKSHIYAFPTQAICITNLRHQNNKDVLDLETRYLKAQTALRDEQASFSAIKDALSLGANDHPGRLEKQYMDYMYENLAQWVKAGKVVYYKDLVTGEYIFYVGDQHKSGFIPYGRVIFVQQGTQVAGDDNEKERQEEFDKRLKGGYWQSKMKKRVEEAEEAVRELISRRPDEVLRRTAASIPVGEIWGDLDSQAQQKIRGVVRRKYQLDDSALGASSASEPDVLRRATTADDVRVDITSDTYGNDAPLSPRRTWRRTGRFSPRPSECDSDATP